MRLLLCATLLILLSACASVPANPTQMTPEQLREWAKVKDASIGCARGLYAGAVVVATWATIDKGIPTGITIKEDCSITFDSKKGTSP